jgi:hypothetical protein
VIVVVIGKRGETGGLKPKRKNIAFGFFFEARLIVIRNIFLMLLFFWAFLSFGIVIFVVEILLLFRIFLNFSVKLFSLFQLKTYLLS